MLITSLTVIPPHKSYYSDWNGARNVQQCIKYCGKNKQINKWGNTSHHIYWRQRWCHFIFFIHKHNEKPAPVHFTAAMNHRITNLCMKPISLWICIKYLHHHIIIIISLIMLLRWNGSWTWTISKMGLTGMGLILHWRRLNKFKGLCNREPLTKKIEEEMFVEELIDQTHGDHVGFSIEKEVEDILKLENLKIKHNRVPFEKNIWIWKNFTYIYFLNIKPISDLHVKNCLKSKIWCI